VKKYRNTSNRHLQFALAGIEIAPGQEVAVADGVARNDPGFQACLESGALEDLGVTRRMSSKAKEPASEPPAAEQVTANLEDE